MTETKSRWKIIRSASNISAKIFDAHTGKFEGDETRVCPRRDPSR